MAGIIKTVIAFANTAGGIIVVGIEDKTKRVVGLAAPLEDEMRIVNKISESVTPLIRPNIDIQAYRDKNIILIQVPYSVGPYYVKKADTEDRAYIRFGSTNRIADADTISAMKSLARNITFDESPCPQASMDDLDWKGLADCFLSAKKHLTKIKAKDIGNI